jgi:hypothetical protein
MSIVKETAQDFLKQHKDREEIPDLSNDTDYDDLVERWQDADCNSEIEWALEQRIAKLISDIDPNNVPEWFLDAMNNDSVPGSAKFAALDKAKEIVAAT